MSGITLSTRRFRPQGLLPAALIVGAALTYAVVSLATAQSAQLSWAGIAGLLQRMVALGITACGQTLVLLVGSIDLSVANLISVSAVIAAHVMNGRPDAIALGIAAAIAIGVIVGLANGLIVSKLKVSPLIATLGIGLVLQGVLSAAYDDLPGSVPASFRVLAYGHVLGIPLALLLLAAVVALAGFVLSRTVIGFRLYGVGGDARTARLAGIRTDRFVIGAHIAASVTAAVSGLYLASWLGAGTPWVGRDGGYDLDSVAVVVIGGTLLSGGRGGVAGTIAGVFVFATIDAVFNMLQIDPFLGQILRGLIVISSVAAYTFRGKAHVA
ncbi:ABC transporter permease [Acidisoma cellulosilytica]|uniref:Autoinducer 2 import system permease protein LsrD n=1 Tax=Acidisoma cellulosilyticum TaxID=2802395 RepID=A0A963Z239_9PROT|nr:ABC transporter permease [Acidisoma cellulosilyticum]MCB8881365.1 ABC transporter permease [Acidisoma cellulosilyticum]